MKKLFALLLIFSLACGLTGCAGLENVELPPFPTFPAEEEVQPSEEPVAEPEPEPSEEPVTEPEAKPLEADHGSRVTVSIAENEKSFFAPDNEDQLILTYAYDDVTVRIEGFDAASQAINDHIALDNELFYMGNGMEGDIHYGVNGMLEMALDNYTYVQESGAEINLEFEADRNAKITRADSRLISLILSDYIYTGGQPVDIAEAYVFDSETGSRLSLADVSQDTAALTEKAAEYMLAQVDGDEAYAGLRGREDLQSFLTSLVAEGTWYIGNDGFTVFTSQYQYGDELNERYRFTVPYSELEGLINEKYLPMSMAGDYSIDISDKNVSSMDVIDKITAAPEGEELYINVTGTIYEVKLAQVVYSNYSGAFQETAELWHCSHIQNGTIQLAAFLPEGIPELMLSFISADGETVKLLIGVSETDGSAELVKSDIVSVG